MEFSNKEKMTDKAFSRIMLSSILAIVLCMAALCSTSYAWFTTSLSTNGQLTAANFDITVSVTDTAAAVEAEEDGSFILPAGEYTVSIQKSANATAQRGYASIRCGSEVFYTQAIDGATIEFTLIAATEVQASFVAEIGICALDDRGWDDLTLTLGTP